MELVDSLNTIGRIAEEGGYLRMVGKLGEGPAWQEVRDALLCLQTLGSGRKGSVEPPVARRAHEALELWSERKLTSEELQAAAKGLLSLLRLAAPSEEQRVGQVARQAANQRLGKRMKALLEVLGISEALLRASLVRLEGDEAVDGDLMSEVHKYLEEIKVMRPKMGKSAGALVDRHLGDLVAADADWSGRKDSSAPERAAGACQSMFTLALEDL